MRRSVVAIIAVFTLVFAFSVPAFPSTDTSVNINTASVKELSSLQKIGPKYSQRIVEYRDTMGPFEAPEDIMKVKGISKKIFEMNKERIVVEDTTFEKKS
ncbi:ComEA family DNA-binding protein [Desulfoluna spongiiphila]|uniref:Competence protein ComEA helix-hairpin-helix repeat region n=1 Tax=Desulfoluna spongiiphila TaxID=419481 RepID=A0A1G5JT82_9BACT|nr:helix-hairpin-helix domain-containing protein [Desulfoluna spongiiphila]SCY91131.1 competence protein ComEA helix-hairpin-helix repeat region [Desulfoluna spongiiphila]